MGSCLQTNWYTPPSAIRKIYVAHSGTPPGISGIGRLKQVDLAFKASLHRDTLSQKKKKRKKIKIWNTYFVTLTKAGV